MIYEYELEIGGHDYLYEPDYYEIREVIEELSGFSEDDIQDMIDNGTWDTDAESVDDAMDELCDDLYDEMCDYFQRKKGDDIKASIEMDEYVDWYYKYGRNI